MANPILSGMLNNREVVLPDEPMTVNGVINKTFILFVFLFVAAWYVWDLSFGGFTDKASMLTTGGALVAFILGFVIVFVRKALNILAPIYAFCEGLAIGGISAIYAAHYAGIVMQAVLATFVVLCVMLGLFRTKIIQCTDKFRAVVITSTLSVGLIYLIQIIASFFGRSIPQIFTASPIGIGFSVVVVIIAALNLIIDFDFIERGSNNMYPKEYEWYGAFGLMVSLVWLYLEILKLIAKSRSRR